MKGVNFNIRRDYLPTFDQIKYHILYIKDELGLKDAGNNFLNNSYKGDKYKKTFTI